MEKLLFKEGVNAFLCGRFSQEGDCMVFRDLSFPLAVGKALRIRSTYVVVQKSGEYIFAGWLFQKMERQEIEKIFSGNAYCWAILKLYPNCKHFMVTVGRGELEVFPLTLFVRVERISDADMLLYLAQHLEIKTDESSSLKYKFCSKRGC